MTPEQAIEAIKANWPPENYTTLCEALKLSISLLEKASKKINPTILESFYQLIRDNPELPVRFSVDTEVCASDEANMWLATPRSVSLEYYANFERGDDAWYDIGNESEIKERIHDFLEYSDFDPISISEERVNNTFDAWVQEGKITKSIILYLGVP